MIKIEHLTRTYGAKVAVDDLCLDVPRGELFCFLGPNGAGKTTTIKVMTGLLRPTSGRVLVDGIDIQVSPVEAKRRIGYIPDMPYLYDRLTTTEFMEFTADLYRVPRSTLAGAIADLFDLFGLSQSANMLIKDLSHGMRQRLIYSATLLHDPRVWFIDEPLIGLDPYTIRLIKDLLIQRAHAGTTIFLTTHILALAEDVADRIGIIVNGRLKALGTIVALRDQHGGRNLEEVFLNLTGGNKS
jgi:ABC-2 type transport system ATP-binding protein